jgi:hypothetical protein
MRKITSLFFVFALCAAGLILCAALIWPVSASAAALINDQGAAELKKLVENELQERLAVTKITGEGLAMEGAVAVTPKSAFYEVKIPGLSISFGPQGKLDIGTVTLNAVPGKAGEWMTSAALPPTMTFYEKPATVIATLSIGSQNFKGAWIPAQGIFPRFDGLYKEITIKGPAADDFKIAIGSLKTVANLKSSGDNILSGHDGFEAGDIKINADGKGDILMDIQKLSLTNIYDSLDISQGMEIRKKILDAAQTATPPDEQSAAFLGGLMSFTGAVPDNLDSTGEADGIVIRTKNMAQKDQPAQEVSLDRMLFQGRVKGAQQQASSATLKGGFNGIRLSPPSGDLAGVVPTTMNIDASMENIPLKKITAMMYDTLQQMIGSLKTTPKSPMDAKNQAESRMSDLVAAMPRILQNAGTSLTIQNTFVKSSEMETDLTGHIQANTTAANGITGKLTLSVKGLEGLIQKLGIMAARPGADEKINAVANGLTALSMMGDADKTPDGKYIHNYVFEITDDNKMLFDNINLQPFLNQGTAP